MKLLSILIASMLSFGAVAGESNHIIGGNIGYGGQDFESDNGGKFGGGDSVGIDAYYRYMLNDNFGLEGSIFSGSGGIVSAMTGIFTTVDHISYKGVRAAIYSQISLSESNSLYAKVGASANQINYDVSGVFGSGTTESIETDGTDFYGVVGWGIRFQSGLGLNLEYQYVPIQELIVQNFSIGISYRF
ncbi:MAG: porin family protein [Shewanella sp.]|nr:porin family protein [Shewanella sp.]